MLPLCFGTLLACVVAQLFLEFPEQEQSFKDIGRIKVESIPLLSETHDGYAAHR